MKVGPEEEGEYKWAVIYYNYHMFVLARNPEEYFYYYEPIVQPYVEDVLGFNNFWNEYTPFSFEGCQIT